MFIYTLYSPASPLITTYSLSTMDVAIGSALTLTCTSSGSPPDTFIWMKDDVPIIQSTSITAVNYTNTIAVFSTNYTISNFSTSDIGTYTCTVSNPIGSDSRMIHGKRIIMYVHTYIHHMALLLVNCIFDIIFSYMYVGFIILCT